MKIAYFGYDLFYPCLEKLINSNDIEVLKVFSFPENEDDKHEKVKAIAMRNGVEFTQKKVTQADIERLVKEECELLVSAGYLYKIPVNDKICGINLHPAKLPVGRGGWPMPQTILKGLKETALTVHMLAARFDEGDILMQKEYVLKEDETLESLNKWYLDNCADIVYTCVTGFDELYKNRRPQGKGEYWPMPSKSDMTVTDKTDVLHADRIVRAFYGSGFFYQSGKEELFIKKAHVVSNNLLAKNYLALKDGGIVVE